MSVAERLKKAASEIKYQLTDEIEITFRRPSLLDLAKLGCEILNEDIGQYGETKTQVARTQKILEKLDSKKDVDANYQFAEKMCSTFLIDPKIGEGEGEITFEELGPGNLLEIGTVISNSPFESTSEVAKRAKRFREHANG